MTSNRNGYLRRLLCLAVAFVMVLSLAACGTDPVTTGSLSAGTQGSTAPSASVQPTTQPTQPTSLPTDPVVPETTVPVEPEPNYALEYTMTQADVDEFYRLLDECEQLSLVGEDMDAIDAAILALDESYEFLNAQCSTALILYYEHTAIKEREQQYLDSVEICTAANDAYLQMARRVYLSDTPAKESLFEGWTDEEIESLLAYDEEISQLQQRNAEIGVEYRAASDDAVKMELYIELIQNNNKIAAYYGYDDYYTYAYERVNERDYGTKEMKQMRKYAKSYLKDIYTAAYSNFYNAYYSNLNFAGKKEVQNFLYSRYNELETDYISLYIDAVPETLSDALTAMLDHDSTFTNASDAMEGAFTTTVGDRSYCYFGPGYWGCTTVMHEGGHYYASLYSDLNGIPLDLAEVHSQANEWLFVTFLNDKMSGNAHNAVVDYMLYEEVAMTLICLMVDEFEQKVYTTDVSDFTAADFDKIMNNIAKKYFPDGDVAEQLADMNYYWRQVVVDQPVYYISYAVSSIAAVSLYTVAEGNFDDAMAIYQQLCEEPVLEAGFLGNIQAAGLYSPFDEEFYKTLQALVDSRGQQ